MGLFEIFVQILFTDHQQLITLTLERILRILKFLIFNGQEDFQTLKIEIINRLRRVDPFEKLQILQQSVYGETSFYARKIIRLISKYYLQA